MKPGVRNGLVSKGTAVFVLALLVVTGVVAALAVTSSPRSTSSQTTTSSGPSTVTALPQGLESFQSYSQLQSFMATNAKSAQNYDRAGGGFLIGGPMMMNEVAGVAVFGAANSAPVAAASTSSTPSSPSFTGTNVQVQGVDEPDLVKTDGAHLFVATNDTGPVSTTNGVTVVNPYPGSNPSSGSVTIMNAYPVSSAAVLSTITIPDASILGLEIAQNRLIVIDQRYSNVAQPGVYGAASSGPVSASNFVGLVLYDTTNLASPKLIGNVTVAGTYVAARLAQGYLYAIIQQPSYQFDSQGNATGVMPSIIAQDANTTLQPTSVYYTPNNAQISDYTMVVSVNMTTGAQSTLSVLTGPSSTIYVSTSNIYVVYSNYRVYEEADGIPGDAFTGGVASPVLQQANSTIFRAAYLNGTVAVQAVGSVPGNVLNQFSMNEYNGYFMVATSRFATFAGNATRSDDVYVLNQNMTQVSALQNIAPGENLYAVRFVGDMGYVVTFEQVDPLFTISFADVTHPLILSALKVNGYSDYLQQLFPGYLIGVGKDTVAASNGNFAYYLGVKLSLFHIASDGTSSDVQDYMIGDRGTDSPVLTNHLAFTFDAANNVTVIPILLYKVSGTQTTSPSSPPPYGSPVWQGAYVLKVSSSGFTLLGMVSQYPANQPYGDSANNNLQIVRSTIIGNDLYTISGGEVMVSDLSSLATVATVALP